MSAGAQTQGCSRVRPPHTALLGKPGHSPARSTMEAEAWGGSGMGPPPSPAEASVKLPPGPARQILSLPRALTPPELELSQQLCPRTGSTGSRPHCRRHQACTRHKAADTAQGEFNGGATGSAGPAILLGDRLLRAEQKQHRGTPRTPRSHLGLPPDTWPHPPGPGQSSPSPPMLLRWI